MGTSKLIDGEYYWVLFSYKEKWEIAKYNASTNRFCFTNGGKSEPSWCSEIDLKPIEKRHGDK